MCGIAGAWTRNPDQSEPDSVRRMAGPLGRRGPDAQGEWFDLEPGLGFVHTRLSILDVSEQGAQPMASASGRWVVSYNGEIYNYQDLRRDIERVDWRGHCDTEVLVEAIDRWGVFSTVQRLNGMFAFAAWDRRDRRLYLVRDRLGIKPLFFARQSGRVLFGSSTSSIRAHPAFVAHLSARGTADYFAFGYTTGRSSILDGVSRVLPGTIVTFSSPEGEPKEDRYWNIWPLLARTPSTHSGADLTDTLDELESRLSQSVRRRLIADVPLGAFLSGGIDSSTVVALMQNQVSRPVRTFSIGFSEPAYDESPFADAVARHLGTDHVSIRLEASAAADIVPELPDFYDEPFSDSSQIATVLVSRLARTQVTVALSGDGGDELFGGYGRYASLARRRLRLAALPNPARRLTGWAARHSGRLLPSPALKLPSRASVPLLRTADALTRLATYLAAKQADRFYLAGITLCTPWLFAGDQAHSMSCLRELDHVSTSDLPDLSFERLMSGLDYAVYLPDDILAKVDRASMGVGLEARVPFLDHELVEWVLGTAPPVGTVGPKALLRTILHRHVPEHLFDRPKMGFGVPIETWLRSVLRGWAEELLSPERIRSEGFFNPTVIRLIWDDFLGGEDHWRDLLWRILMFQAWTTHTRIDHIAPIR